MGEDVVVRDGRNDTGIIELREGRARASRRRCRIIWIHDEEWWTEHEIAGAEYSGIFAIGENALPGDGKLRSRYLEQSLDPIDLSRRFRERRR